MASFLFLAPPAHEVRGVRVLRVGKRLAPRAAPENADVRCAEGFRPGAEVHEVGPLAFRSAGKLNGRASDHNARRVLAAEVANFLRSQTSSRAVFGHIHSAADATQFKTGSVKLGRQGANFGKGEVATTQRRKAATHGS